MYNLAGKEVLNEHARMHSAYSCLSPHIHRINLEFPLYRGLNKKVLHLSWSVGLNLIIIAKPLAYTFNLMCSSIITCMCFIPVLCLPLLK